MTTQQPSCPSTPTRQIGISRDVRTIDTERKEKRERALACARARARPLRDYTSSRVLAPLFEHEDDPTTFSTMLGDVPIETLVLLVVLVLILSLSTSTTSVMPLLRSL